METQDGPPGVEIRFDTHRLDTRVLKRHSIKVVIQEMPGGRYWECQGLWTSDFQSATSFATCTAAMAHVAHLKLSNAQLVLTRESTAYGIIPLKQASETSRLEMANGAAGIDAECRLSGFFGQLTYSATDQNADTEHSA